MTAKASESGVLAALIEADGTLPPELDRILLNSPEVFDDQRHGYCAVAVQKLRNTSTAVNLVSLERKLTSDGVLEVVGIDFLRSMSSCGLPTAIAIVEADLLWKEFEARKGRLLLSEAITELDRQPDMTLPVLKIAQRGISELLDASSLNGHEPEPPVEAKPIGLLERPPENDPTELLKYRFLCERGSLLIPGPTGMGKSSFLLQCLALWANCLPAFGIIPARALTSVIIQAENDDGDMAEMRDGICLGLGLTVSQRENFFTRVLVYSSAGLTGRAFCTQIVKPILERHHSNLLCIDPALSYMGGDTKDQKDVGGFLRVHLNPLIFANKCASLMIHHTNKPLAGKEKPNWKNGEFAYLGSGSAEWANWARAVLSLQSTGTAGVYSLHAAKRGSRLGWKDAEGDKVYEKLIKHSVESGVICWKDATEEDLSDSGAGRPEKCGLPEVLELIADQSLSTGDWRSQAEEELGIGKTTFHRKLDLLKAEGSVSKNKITGRWEKILKRP